MRLFATTMLITALLAVSAPILSAGGGVRFSTTPPDTGFVGVEYVYDADAVGPNPSDLVRYRSANLPSGASLDTVSGVFRFTTGAEGRVTFTITAYLAADPNIAATQTWKVVFGRDSILNPGGCGAIAGIVLDQNSSPVDGMAYARRAGDPAAAFISTKILRGGFFIQTPDSAEYVVKVTGSTFATEWYDDSDTEANATPLLVRCGDTVRIAVTVQSAGSKTISGRVLSAADSSALTYAKVLAVSSTGASYHAYTTPTGTYSLPLPEGGKYILYAKDISGAHSTIYYDGVSDKSLATTIDLTADLAGIDFYLPRVQVYRNGLEGFVKDSSASSSVAAMVKLFRIEGSDPSRTAVKVAVTDTDSARLDGRFMFYNLEPGAYIIYVIPYSKDYVPGYYVQNDPAVSDWLSATQVPIDSETVSTGHIVRLSRRSGLTGGGILRGTIAAKVSGFAGDTAPLSEATARVTDMNGSVSSWNVADASGAYEMRDLPQGAVTLIVDMPGYQPYSTILEIPSGSNPVNHTVEMTPLGVTSVDVAAPAREAGFTLHPNPASGSIVVLFTEPIDRAGAMQVYNALGILVRSSAIAERTATVSLDIQGLPAGVYLAVPPGGKAGRPFRIVR